MPRMRGRESIIEFPDPTQLARWIFLQPLELRVFMTGKGLAGDPSFLDLAGRIRSGDREVRRWIASLGGVLILLSLVIALPCMFFVDAANVPYLTSLGVAFAVAFLIALFSGIVRGVVVGSCCLLVLALTTAILPEKFVGIDLVGLTIGLAFGQAAHVSSVLEYPSRAIWRLKRGRPPKWTELRTVVVPELVGSLFVAGVFAVSSRLVELSDSWLPMEGTRVVWLLVGIIAGQVGLVGHGIAIPWMAVLWIAGRVFPSRIVTLAQALPTRFIDLLFVPLPGLQSFLVRMGRSHPERALARIQSVCDAGQAGPGCRAQASLRYTELLAVARRGDLEGVLENVLFARELKAGETHLGSRARPHRCGRCLPWRGFRKAALRLGRTERRGDLASRKDARLEIEMKLDHWCRGIGTSVESVEVVRKAWCAVLKARRKADRRPDFERFLFISYRRIDTREVAHRLFHDLSERLAPDQVFLDSRMGFGEAWRSTLSQNLIRASHFFALIGPRWLGSEDRTRSGFKRLPQSFMREEIEFVNDRPVVIVPVLVDGVTVPDFFGDFQAEKIDQDRWERGLRKLVDRLVQDGFKPAV